MAPDGGMGAAVYVTFNVTVTIAHVCWTSVISAAGLLSVGFKSRQNAFERVFLLAFAFAPDFMLLSASWEPFFLWNYTAILLCWMFLERAGPTSKAANGQKKAVDQPVPYRALQSSDACRGLVFLFLVHAVSLTVSSLFSALTFLPCLPGVFLYRKCGKHIVRKFFFGRQVRYLTVIATGAFTLHLSTALFQSFNLPSCPPFSCSRSSYRLFSCRRLSSQFAECNGYLHSRLYS